MPPSATLLWATTAFWCLQLAICSTDAVDGPASAGGTIAFIPGDIIPVPDDAVAARADAKFYFYNEVTGEVQWEDPGDVPYEDASGGRYWLSDTGEPIFDQTQHTMHYVWLEQFSQDLGRPFFFNQETRTSHWERPADLAWRRIAMTPES